MPPDLGLLLLVALGGFMPGLFLGALYGISRRNEIAHNAHHYAFHGDCRDGGYHRHGQ